MAQQAGKLSSVVSVVAATAALFGYLYWDLTKKPARKPPPEAPPAAPTFTPKQLAWTASQVLVEKQLKAPSSAKYGCDPLGEPTDRCVREVGGDQYLVSGWVDSQNALGVMMRSDFRVLLQRTDAGDWNLVTGPELEQR